MCLGDVFLNFKGKVLSAADLASVARRMRERGMGSVSLWNLSSNTRMMFNMVRWQSYSIILAACLWLPPTVYEKYEEDHSKATILSIFVPIATGFILTPLMLYRRQAGRMLSSIEYNLTRNSIQLKTYNNKTLLVAP